MTKNFFILTLIFTLITQSIPLKSWALDSSTQPQVQEQEINEDYMGNASEGNEGQYAAGGWSMALALGGIFGGTMMMLSCRNQASAWAFAGASSAHILGEIYNWIEFRDASEREMKAFTNTTEKKKKTQVDSLQKAASLNDNAISAAETRQTLMYITAGLYGVAAVIAGVEAVAAMSPLTAGSDFCTKSFVYQDQHKQSDDFLNGLDRNLSNSAQRLVYQDALQSSRPLDAYFIWKEYNDFSQGGLQSPTYNEYERLSLSITKNKIKIDEELGSKLAQISNLVSQMIIPSAQAIVPTAKNAEGMAAFGILGGAALAGASAGLTKVMMGSNSVYTGWDRAIFFGLWAGALAIVAKTTLQSSIDTLKDRSRRFRELAKKLEVAGNTEVQPDPDVDSNNNNKAGPSIETPQVPSGETPDGTKVSGSNNCVAGDFSKGLSLDQNCDCSKKNACAKPATISKDVYPNTIKQDGDIMKALDNVKKMSNSFGQGKNTASAFYNKGSASKLAADMKNKLRRQEELANKALKEAGKPPIDFSKEMELRGSKIRAELKKAMDSFPGDQKNAFNQLASLATTEDESLAKSDDQAKEELKSQGIDLSSLMASFSPPQGPRYKSALEEEKSQGQEDIQTDKALASHKLNMGDIKKDSSVSIFNMISVRYKKSAYPRFYERKQAPASLGDQKRAPASR